METENITLCFPDQKKSCFACCPPIRPSGYEHIQHKNIIRRILRENSNFFHKNDKTIVPITGFSCWALGYLDDDCRTIGCMLHPIQNRGVDLRYRIDYGDKCRRETCPEEKIFSLLDFKEKRYWLQLANGLDSFAYSSMGKNPLFLMLGWGAYLLRLIASKESLNHFTRESFFRSYRFFTSDLNPKATAYIINCLMTEENLDILKEYSFVLKVEVLLGQIRKLIKLESQGKSDGPYVHLLDIDPSFTDFLRLYMKIYRMESDEVQRLKSIVDQELVSFKRSLSLSY